MWYQNLLSEVQKNTGEYQLLNISTRVSKLCNMHQGDGKFNSSFQLNSIQGSGSIGPIFSEELAGVNSAETRRQGVIELFVCAYVVVKDSVTIPNQNKFFYVTLLYS